jgi:hypothetical protein
MSISAHLELQQNWRMGHRMIVRLQYAGGHAITVAAKSVLGEVLHGVEINYPFEALLAEISNEALLVGAATSLGLTTYALPHVEACNFLYLPEDRMTSDLVALLST